MARRTSSRSFSRSRTAGLVRWPLGKMSVNWRSVMKSRRPAGARRKSPRSLASCDGIFAVGDGESEADRAGVGDWASSVDGVEEAGDPARRVEDGTDLLGRKTPVRSVDNNSHKPRRSRFHRLHWAGTDFWRPDDSVAAPSSSSAVFGAVARDPVSRCLLNRLRTGVSNFPIIITNTIFTFRRHHGACSRTRGGLPEG
jgi:hypothetical protein